jgi:hypothetical protein
MEIRESDKENAVQFAIAMRRAIRDPARWDKLIRVSRDLITVPVPDDAEDLVLIALAHLMAICSARTLPANDPVRTHAEQLLNSIAAFSR